MENDGLHEKIYIKRRYFFHAATFLVVFGIFTFELLCKKQPLEVNYTILEQQGAIELREYSGLIIAEVEILGPRKQALQEGFRRLASYIFGKNDKKQKISMTSPVFQKVMGTGDKWKIIFLMPPQTSKDDLPLPLDSGISLHEVHPQKYWVLRFSGMGNDENIFFHLKQLKEFLVKREIIISDTPLYAFYSLPWSLPFMKRNEIFLKAQIASVK